MKVSVVINTYNRAPSLRVALDALRHQTHEDFEVVVVNGPSSDGTGALLRERAADVRVVDCPETHLAKSRNLGIDAAAGEVVAFIDDDAIPEPDWLAGLVAAYDDERVGGAGGIVLDHTGVHVQYRFSLCDRLGVTDFDQEPPFDANNEPGCERFVYLQGTNCSFRRAALEQIRGFDEEIEYNYDESEVCLQMVDHGWKLQPLSGAAVHHKFLASHQRREAGFFTDPFFPIKNRAYFTLRNGRGHYPLDLVFRSLSEYVHVVRSWADDSHRRGKFTPLEHDRFVERLEAGYELGLERGLRGERQSRDIAPRPVDAFKPYPTLRPQGRRLAVAFVSIDYAPKAMGGIARFTSDLGRGLAAEGHEVHVVTRDDDGPYRLDFEDGVWVHRFPVGERWAPALREHHLAGNFAHLTAVWRAVDRILERRRLDVVSGPLWIAEPLLCAFDPRVATTMACMTPLSKVAETQPVIAMQDHTPWQIRLEEAALRSVPDLWSVSHANLETIAGVPGASVERGHVIWLGVEDVRAHFPRRRPVDDDAIELLFVGRLEPRKGVDVLLESAAELLRARPQVRLRLVGADTGYGSGGRRYADWWAERFAAEPALLGQVIFDGEVSDEELFQRYADADVFCAPSRYESFGLVAAEAMMMGLPVVATAAGGMGEVTIDGENGLLVDPGDTNALRDALARLADDAELRRRFAEAGRARYDAEFRNEHAVERTASYFRELASRRAGRPPAAPGEARSAVREGLARLLADVAELDAVTAADTAETLLAPDAFPVDYVAGVRRIFGLPDHEFIEALYQLLLRRDVDPSGRAGSMIELAARRPRMEIVREMAESIEAAGLGVDARFLERVDAWDQAEALRRVRSCWTLPPDRFVNGLWVELAGRDATAAERDASLALLAAGTRRDVLADLLERPAVRRRVALPQQLLEAELLDRDAIEQELARLAALPPGDFVNGAYRLLLGRDADPDGAAAYVEHATAGDRLRVVRALAHSDEARERGLEIGWLAGVEQRVPDLCPRSLARRVRRLPGATRAEQLTRKAVRRARRNSELTGLRSDLERHDRALRESQAQLAAAVASRTELARLDERMSLLQARLESDDTALRQVTGGVKDLREHVSGRLEWVNETTARVGDRVGGLAERIDVLRTKHEALAMDMRERVPVQPPTDELPAPVVVDQDAVQRVLEAGGLKLNLGCGEKPLDGYVNVDFRPLPGVQVVADVRRLPFGPGSVDELMSAHLVEHFRQHHLATVLLPYWRSLLAADGVLRTICPNWSVMIDQLNRGELSFAEFKTVTFGLQDYSGDDHFAMYSPETFMATLREAGFDRFEVVTEHRQNGLAPEMEILARPAADMAAASEPQAAARPV